MIGLKQPRDQDSLNTHFLQNSNLIMWIKKLLKFTEHVMKVMERIVDGMIREMIAIDEMQFAFVPGRGTTDAIFIIRQLQEKFLSRKDLNDKNLTLFFAFVDLEKAFDHVPRKVLWWAMRKVGVEEWIVRLVQAMYNNARSQVRVGCEYS